MGTTGGAAAAGAAARPIVAVMLALGTAAGLGALAVWPWPVAALVGWDVAAAFYLARLWLLLWRLDPGGTKAVALADDPGRAVADLVLTAASVASLVAVALVVVRAGNSSGGEAIGLAGFGLASVFASWAVVHATYTLRYARLYYGDVPGGVDFNTTEPPQYSDFAYLSFSVGMTFQVSDTSLETKEFRATVLRQSLLSYFFGAVVIGATINLVAGLAK
jgi:uncharacterized membrane protein